MTAAASPESSIGRGIENQILLVLMAGGALVLAPLVRSALPERFLSDDGHLQLAMDPATAHLTDASFLSVGAIYTALGLADSPVLAGLLNIALFTACAVAALGWERIRDARPWELAVAGVALLIGLVYLAQYSKELLTLAISALVVLAPRSRWGDVLIVAACVAYGAFARPYWILIAALFLLWRAVLPRTRSVLVLVLVPVLVYLALQPAFTAALGGGLQSAREGVNEARADAGPVASIIASPLPDSPGPLGVLAALLMIVLMVVPIPLLASFSPYHVISGAVILAFWLFVLVPVVRGRLVVRRGRAASRGRIIALRAAAVLLAMLMTQALFEPDYGSALKHLAPLMPLMLALLPAARGARTEPVTTRAASSGDIEPVGAAATTVADAGAGVGHAVVPAPMPRQAHGRRRADVPSDLEPPHARDRGEDA